MEYPAIADSLFPSGRWKGFYIEKRHQFRLGKHGQEMFLTFTEGRISGEGSDNIDRFSVSGSYASETGECKWTKWYDNSFNPPVRYKGFNEGKGIWGTWDINTPSENASGGFKIWPDGMPEDDADSVKADVEEPVEQTNQEILKLELAEV